VQRIGVGICITVMAVVALAGPASADGVDGCTLVTKKEASKILGAKVVTAENVVDGSTGGQTCTFTTKKYATKAFKQAGSTVGLVLQWVSLTDAVSARLQGTQPAGGVADAAAYLLDDGTVAAVRGADVVLATVQYVKGGLAGAAKKSLRLLKLAVPRLPTE
jgi:hypothetical protein